MEIRNNMLVGARYTNSPNRSGPIQPKFIVQHYTAGYTASGAISWLNNPESQASAHVVIDYDGTITQLVPFNIKAWHAGPSSYKGYNGLNNYSIGIEIVNVGPLRKTDNGRYKAQNNIMYSEQDFRAGFTVESHPRVGSGLFYWPNYTDRQLQAVEDLTEELINQYPIIDIVSHEEIDNRGWKTDPGPAFPMQRMKRHLRNFTQRDTDEELYEVTASSLNIRSGPGTEFSIIGSLRIFSVAHVYVTRGDWAKISDDGWVHKSYLRPI